MVDDFMVCVDRIIASACFESVHGGVFDSAEGAESISANAGVSLKNNGEGCSKKEDMVECRICQEEGEERDMEAPCGCNGTLKVLDFTLFPKDHFFLFLSLLLLFLVVKLLVLLFGMLGFALETIFSP